ncbi:hypothetical protein ACMD2_19577 [Ananas comosus]|uniref:Uncharacterized protein n=1 Tax=Ananas comosus TaxID=4615 RepID=A0A199V8X3_ANACO|nr:hypothetical protein ACMD2_19577 [Ananas comosus]
MKVNKEKSELFYTGQVEGKARSLADLLECNVGTLPTKYLGLPLSSRAPSKADWMGVIQKIQSRIDGWRAKLLWCGEKALQLAYPEVYEMAECRIVKAKDCLGSDGWNWNQQAKLRHNDSVVIERITFYPKVDQIKFLALAVSEIAYKLKQVCECVPHT